MYEDYCDQDLILVILVMVPIDSDYICPDIANKCEENVKLNLENQFFDDNKNYLKNRRAKHI